MIGVIASLILGGVILLIGWGVYQEHLVRHWDEKITALCTADGGRNVGLRVYERVMAPESYIRPAVGAMPAYLNVPWRVGGEAPKRDAPIVMELVELKVLRDASPRVIKFSSSIVRVIDSKVLAEELGYMRYGGGIPMPTPDDRYGCPGASLTEAGASAIYSEVFVNHPSNLTQRVIK